MTITKRQYQAYAAAMQTMAGTRQIVLLYDGIIRCLQQARDGMRDANIESRFNNLTRASEIVFGLQSCLDFERGGQVASVLYNFYASIDARIFALHRTPEPADCDRLIDEIRQMRDVWDEIDQSAGGAGAVAMPAAQPQAGTVAPPSAGSSADSGGVTLSA